MEQIIFIAIVLVVGLVRLIAQAAETRRNTEADKRNAPAPSTTIARTPARRSEPQTEEERIRKFLEALGVPTSADPPKKVQPRQVAPAPSAQRKILPVDPFPAPRGRPLASAPPPLPASPPPMPETLPLPPPPTTVVDLPRTVRPDFARSAEFEIKNLDEAIAEDAFSHSGLRIDGDKAQAPVAIASLVARLGTEQGLRDAMVLREIFGLPRSLQSIDRRAAA